MGNFKKISFEEWGRNDQRVFFGKHYHCPHFNVTVNLDVTRFKRSCKERGVSFFQATVHSIAKAVNGVPQLRQRLRDDCIVEWEKVNPSYTVLSDDENMLFCDAEYFEDFETFLGGSLEAMEKVKSGGILPEDPDITDDVICMSCLPWISFTGMVHPLPLDKNDSMPRISWGKVFKEGDKLLMPFNVQAHHSVVDGLHVSRLINDLQNLFEQA